MTKEIELYKIGETYIKFDFEYSESNKLIIKEAFLEQLETFESEYFKKDRISKISIEFERGSLKSRLIFWAGTIYLGVANYGSFRAGVREISSDIKHVSEVIIENITTASPISDSNIIRTEKRTGIPGRLQELYKRIDDYEKNLDNLSNSQQHAQLIAIKTEISNLTELLSAQDKQIFLSELNIKYSSNLPQPDQRRANYLINRYAIKPEEEVEFIK